MTWTGPDRVAEAGLVEARRAEDVVFCMQNLHVLGFVEMSLGNHEAAQAHLGEATDLMRPRWSREFGDCHVVPDEIEALVALGDLARAEDLAAWMDEVGRAHPACLDTGDRCPVPGPDPGCPERPRRGRCNPGSGRWLRTSDYPCPSSSAGRSWRAASFSAG